MWCATCISSAANAPREASAIGYHLNTFSTEFTGADVDITNSGKAGFSWYPWSLFSSHTKTSAIVLNRDHSTTLTGDSTGPNGELTTVKAAANAAKFVGTAFGGGAYIEAELRFDPNAVAAAGSKGWPSFWALALEGGVLDDADHWSGQSPGYRHNVEVDFFEYLLLPYGGPRNAYGASMHDWYGIPNRTCARGLCQESFPFSEGKRLVPEGTDFNRFHRYGFCWVPATPSTQGSARFYFDDQEVGRGHQWAEYTNQPPPPTHQSWAFAKLDQQHIILILGTGPNEPMTVRSVNVWQASASQNLHN